MFAIGTTIAVFFVTLLFVYNWQNHRYWKSRGVPTSAVCPLIGHYYMNFVGYRWEHVDKMYRTFKPNGFWGMYEAMAPTLHISDPAYIREIMVKEADHFIDRRPIVFEGEEKILNEMLTIVEGEKWKSLRSLVSPTFTSGKMKGMFHLVDHKVKELMKQCEKDMDEKSFVEIKSLFCYYTMDVIGTCAFGIDAHCLQLQEKSKFIEYGNSIASFSLYKFLKFVIIMISPKLYNVLGLQMNSGRSLRFFSDVVEKSVDLRRKSGVRRGDFLDLMLEALDESERKGGDFKYPMTMNTVISESVLFLLAGFDPTSNTLAFMAYLLAKNTEAQDILRKELQKVVEADGELNYQNVLEAPYLDACLSETLRIYAPAHFAERSCTKKFKLPGTDLEIPEKMIVGIPIWSLHRDPEYWEDPSSFLPDRFLPENKSKIKPYTYLPFGLGPRNCIGMRFAQMEAKFVMARLCLDFEIELRPGFTEMVLEKTNTTLRPNKSGVQLVLKKITKSGSTEEFSFI